MKPYQLTQGSSLLQQSVTHTNPIEFVLIEDMLLRMTKDRAPQWRPKQLLKPGGYQRYKDGQEDIRAVEAMIRRSWLDMTQALLQARTNLVAWQANALLREQVWAEQVRQQNRAMADQLDFQEKRMLLEDGIAKLKEVRAHTYAKDIIELRHVMELQLLDVKLGQEDPVVKMQRFLQALENAKPVLQTYAAEDDTHQVDSWIAEAVLDGMRVLSR